MSWAKAWRDAATTAVDDLDRPWVLAGSGGRSRAVMTPVRWWLSSVGFNAGRAGTGELFASHQPLTVPIISSITLDQQSYTGDDKPRPDFDPGDDDAATVLRWWITGPAHNHFTDLTEAQWIDQVEKEFEIEPEIRPYRWPMLAGLRLIRATGPAEPVIDAVLQSIEDDLYYDEQKPWWEEFRSVVGGSREESVRWLDTQRRHALKHFGVPDDAIADTATG